MTPEQAADRFVNWLDQRVIRAGRGDDMTVLDVEPRGRFWLGRLTSESAVIQSGLGDRGERLDPCAIGIRCKPAGPPPWSFQVKVCCYAWTKNAAGTWQKTRKIARDLNVVVAGPDGEFDYGGADLESLLTAEIGQPALTCEVRVEVQRIGGAPELTILLVNTSPADAPPLNVYR